MSRTPATERATVATPNARVMGFGEWLGGLRESFLHPGRRRAAAQPNSAPIATTEMTEIPSGIAIIPVAVRAHEHHPSNAPGPAAPR